MASRDNADEIMVNATASMIMDLMRGLKRRLTPPTWRKQFIREYIWQTCRGTWEAPTDPPALPEGASGSSPWDALGAWHPYGVGPDGVVLWRRVCVVIDAHG